MSNERHYCAAAYPDCQMRYEDGDMPESVACDRRQCPTRELLTARRAYERSGVHIVDIPSLRREAARRRGAS